MVLATYTVTTDKAVFCIVLRKLFQERELSTLMSIICCYSEAVEEVPENALYTKIDYYKTMVSTTLKLRPFSKIYRLNID